jgi:osmotically-inducible protein OsmY
MYLAAAVKLRLLEDERIPARDIAVDAIGGVVTLFGSVPTHAARAAAQADARHVTGVRRIENELQVIASHRRDIQAGDRIIRHAICATLAEHNITNVTVSVENGVVRLTGTVPSIWSQLKTTMIARYTDGVLGIRDDLHVEE